MNSTSKLLIFSAVLFIVSCTQPSDMLTVIAPNGSCYREFTAKADPQFLSGDTLGKLNPFPVDIDSTWKITWKYKNSTLQTTFPVKKTVLDSIVKSVSKTVEIKIHGKADQSLGDRDIIVYARQNYTSPTEMDTRFKFRRSNPWSGLEVKHLLDSKFRWFYTYYTYKETYPKLKTGFSIPVEKFMTKDEAMFWFTGKPDILKGMNGVEIREYVGTIEDNFRTWFNKNLWDSEYRVLLENYSDIANLQVSKGRLEVLKDTIFNAKVNKTDNFKMEQILDSYFKTTVFTAFWKTENCPMVKFESDFNNQGFVEYFQAAFTYKLIMPGVVTGQNNAVVHGDTLVWNLTAYRLIPAPYVIEAQSRKANIWAFILTGIIFIVAIGSFILKPGKG
jgi:hypothetical protein